MADESSGGKNGNGHNGNGNGNGHHSMPLEVEVLNLGGRPTLWREEFLDEIKEIVGVGSSIKDIAAYLGVNDETLRLWRRDRPEINEAIAKAKAELKIRCQRKILKATEDVWEDRIQNGIVVGKILIKKGEWTAAAWMLERLDPEQWGRKSNLQVEVKQNAITKEIIEEAERRLKLM